MNSKYVFAATLVLLILSCAAPIKNLTKVNYLNDQFSAETLQYGGIALLPVTAGHGQEGYRRPLGDTLSAYLPKTIPDGKTIDWQTAMNLLNSHNLVSEYQQIIESYQRTSILNREKIMKLGEALGVRYALYCALQDYSESKNTSYNLFSGFSTTKTANVQAHCLVFDLTTGDVMQEIIGQAASEAGDMSYNRGYEVYAKILAQAVLSKLPGSKVAPPQGTTY